MQQSVLLSGEGCLFWFGLEFVRRTTLTALALLRARVGVRIRERAQCRESGSSEFVGVLREGV